MSPKRVKQRFSDFKKALKRLEEVLEEDPKISSAIIDATLKRFEFTFELAWKVAQDILSYEGIAANNPRSVIKESYKEGLLKEGASWINMLEDRNKSVHIYDQKEAKKIYRKIKKSYYQLLIYFKDAAIEKIATIK